MGRIQKITIIGLILLVLVPIISTSGATSGGDFIIPDNRDYYPETILTLQLENLTVNDNYAILIGANQNTSDQQWDNFTADSTSMEREIIHFNTQTYLTNQSQEIDNLLIELYDNQSTRLSLITFPLVRIKDQINPYLFGMLLVVGVSSIVLMNILFVLVKVFYK